MENSRQLRRAVCKAKRSARPRHHPLPSSLSPLLSPSPWAATLPGFVMAAPGQPRPSDFTCDLEDQGFHSAQFDKVILFPSDLSDPGKFSVTNINRVVEEMKRLAEKL